MPPSRGPAERAADPRLAYVELRPLLRGPVRRRRCGAARPHAIGRGHDCTVCMPLRLCRMLPHAGHRSGIGCRAPRSPERRGRAQPRLEEGACNGGDACGAQHATQCAAAGYVRNRGITDAHAMRLSRGGARGSRLPRTQRTKSRRLDWSRRPDVSDFAMSCC